jgi:hypothetical protein
MAGSGIYSAAFSILSKWWPGSSLPFNFVISKTAKTLHIFLRIAASFVVACLVMAGGVNVEVGVGWSGYGAVRSPAWPAGLVGVTWLGSAVWLRVAGGAAGLVFLILRPGHQDHTSGGPKCESRRPNARSGTVRNRSGNPICAIWCPYLQHWSAKPAPQSARTIF